MNQPLQIGIDATRAAGNRSGLGNYSRNLIEHLSQLYSDNRYYLFSKHKFLPDYEYIKSLPGIAMDGQFDKLDIYHGLSHTLPMGLKCAKIVTFHDLIFKRYPEGYRWHDRWSYDLRFRYSAKVADRILADSQATKDDLVEFYKVNPDKITVAYLSASSQFKELQVDSVLEQTLRDRYKLNGRIILSVGTIESRKNALSAVKAFHSLNSITKDATLLLVGKETAYTKSIKQYILENSITNIQISHNVPFNDLISLYNLAYVSVMISFFEGFGMPILESMQCGTPAIVSNCSSLQEVGGTDGSCFLCDPASLESIAGAMKTALEDSSAYALVKSNLAAQTEKFAPTRTTELVMQAYQSVL